MREIKLNPRLMSVASFIEKGDVVADIGTDHGYLPIWLIKSGICQNSIAADLRPGPLSQAKRFAAQFDVSERISFRLGDGLSPVAPGEADTIVLAGMGGETIINILSEASWVKDGGVGLILQPQSKIPELLAWLNANGFSIADAKLAEDIERVYLVLKVVKDKVSSLAPVEYYVPKILIDRCDILLGSYVQGLIDKLNTALEGMGKSRENAYAERIEFISAALKGLYEIKGRIKSE